MPEEFDNILNWLLMIKECRSFPTVPYQLQDGHEFYIIELNHDKF